MFCPYCGTQIPDSSVFCGTCGKQVAQIPDPEPVDKKYYVPAQKKTPDRRTALFGVFALIVAILYPLADLFWRLSLYRMFVDDRFMLRPFLGMFREGYILSMVGFIGMFLIAIYYLALYPKRKGAWLAAIGAILIIISRLIFSMTAVIYMLSAVIVVVGATLLAVYWFSGERAAALGVIGPVFCIGATLLTQMLDLLQNGLAFGSPLFWAGLVMDALYILFWVIVLIANIATNNKKTD